MVSRYQDSPSRNFPNSEQKLLDYINEPDAYDNQGLRKLYADKSIEEIKLPCENFMKNDSTKLIREWFAEHDGNGEFVSGIKAFPYSVIGSTDSAGHIIFTTKPTIVSAIIHNCETAQDFGMVGRYGLPDASDLHWIRKMIGLRPLLFFGDMDPVDLMVFAWLRANLHSKCVTHLGVNDAFLKSLNISSVKTLSSPCAPSELKSLVLLKKVLPYLREVVGQKCNKMLEKGYKIELDMIVSNIDKVAGQLRSLFSKLKVESR